MNIKELIERLRGLNAEHPPFGAAHEAADALLAQQVVIEQMRDAIIDEYNYQCAHRRQ